MHLTTGKRWRDMVCHVSHTLEHDLLLRSVFASRHQSLPVVSGHVLISRDTSLDEFIFKFTLSSNFDPV